MAINRAQRDKVMARSDGFCEAMIKIDRVWTRCWTTPVEIHHLLTRARGGNALDMVDEDYHLIALCHVCHGLSDGEMAYSGNLLIEGYATWNAALQRPVYVGPDKYLTEKYGAAK